ncbi:hypothetical protein ALC62_03950 [Cyphomyrmex costatus]|uniref:Uncharacterized protein n=1 Tax=Cyphomyrmex costatus TaxID=456900 RepID=A0A195CWX9_9HYME|nr:hypothetical protein ALC62_03950 [Cyphomyrmex costatus]
MSEDSYEEIIRQINEAHMELKIRLEQVSRLRIDCAKLQLELLKLFKPQCLEILEVIRDISVPADFIDLNNGDGIESRDNQVCSKKYRVFVLNMGPR